MAILSQETISLQGQKAKGIGTVRRARSDLNIPAPPHATCLAPSGRPRQARLPPAPQGGQLVFFSPLGASSSGSNLRFH